jgi:dTDP-4-dehydrorhamnose 3,5-epimerase-like enzyme
MFVLCHDFAERGPNSTVAQTNTSFNYTRGTLRDLHRRMPPYAEAELVRCARGAIVDVEVRPKSQTVCRTRLPDAGQHDGSRLPGQRSLQASLGDLQDRRHESGMGCWSGA